MEHCRTGEERLEISWTSPGILLMRIRDRQGHVPSRAIISDIRFHQTSARERPEAAPRWVVMQMEAPHAASGDAHPFDEDALLDSVDMLLDNIDGWGADVITVAAIESHARDAILETAASCDLVVCAASTRFGFTPNSRSMGAAFGGDVLLARRIGEEGLRMARGETEAGARDMLASGLVNRVSCDGDALGSALQLIDEIDATRSKHLQARRSLAQCNPIRPDQLYLSSSQWLGVLDGMRPQERAAYLA